MSHIKSMAKDCVVVSLGNNIDIKPTRANSNKNSVLRLNNYGSIIYTGSPKDIYNCTSSLRNAIVSVLDSFSQQQLFDMLTEVTSN